MNELGPYINKLRAEMADKERRIGILAAEKQVLQSVISTLQDIHTALNKGNKHGHTGRESESKSKAAPE
ncbi:MAG: hypothetical protein DRR04_10330 [Gammaproteobacteria bacterium]|nr:MAG: hypothetical protein DRQ97_12990 [Gammaproteobacteria bacterium]RLA58704.1 MAG: hypothetical protein DRR04_10330 [Gammaproteobacteria bacterium]